MGRRSKCGRCRAREMAGIERGLPSIPPSSTWARGRALLRTEDVDAAAFAGATRACGSAVSCGSGGCPHDLRRFSPSTGLQMGVHSTRGISKASASLLRNERALDRQGQRRVSWRRQAVERVRTLCRSALRMTHQYPQLSVTYLGVSAQVATPRVQKHLRGVESSARV